MSSLASWEAAGLDTADAPQSYEELLDFAGRWAERAEAGEAGNICLNTLRSCGYAMDERRYTLWLTDLLLDIWIMRHQAAGEALIFNTPKFIALAERARAKRVGPLPERKGSPPQTHFRSMMGFFQRRGPATADRRTCIPTPFPCA